MLSPNVKGVLLIACLTISGCYSVSPLAVQRDIESSVPIGADKNSAYETLQRKGFSPTCENPEMICGCRVTGILFFVPMDWVNVQVYLNAGNKVTRVHAAADQSYP
jgi:hypothetical protein